MDAIDKLEAQMNHFMTAILLRVLRANGHEEDTINSMQISGSTVTVSTDSAAYTIDRKSEKVVSYEPIGGVH